MLVLIFLLHVSRAFIVISQGVIGQAALNLTNGLTRNRNPSFYQQRLKWDSFVSTIKDTPLFKRHLRMPYNSFLKLLDLIREKIQVDEEKASK